MQREVEEHARRVRAAEKAAAAAEEALKVGLGWRAWQLARSGCVDDAACCQGPALRMVPRDQAWGSREQGRCTGGVVRTLGLCGKLQAGLPWGGCAGAGPVSALGQL